MEQLKKSEKNIRARIDSCDLLCVACSIFAQEVYVLIMIILLRLCVIFFVGACLENGRFYVRTMGHFCIGCLSLNSINGLLIACFYR